MLFLLNQILWLSRTNPYRKYWIGASLLCRLQWFEGIRPRDKIVGVFLATMCGVPTMPNGIALVALFLCSIHCTHFFIPFLTSFCRWLAPWQHGFLYKFIWGFIKRVFRRTCIQISDPYQGWSLPYFCLNFTPSKLVSSSTFTNLLCMWYFFGICEWYAWLKITFRTMHVISKRSILH